jgi:hypothetical protein
MTLSCDPVLIRSAYGHARDYGDETARTHPTAAARFIRDTGRRQLAGSALAPDAGPLRVTASQAGLMARAVVLAAVRVRAEPVLPRSKVRAVTGLRVFRGRRDGGRFRLCRWHEQGR